MGTDTFSGVDASAPTQNLERSRAGRQARQGKKTAAIPPNNQSFSELVSIGQAMALISLH
jgi:hypothetical protein